MIKMSRQVWARNVRFAHIIVPNHALTGVIVYKGRITFL